MRKNICITISFIAYLFPIAFFLSLVILTKNFWAILVFSILSLGYVLIVIPYQVCLGSKFVTIKTITGYNKKIIHWTEIRSLSISKIAEPSLPLQFVIRFKRGDVIKRQSFGMNRKSKILSLIKAFESNNVLIISDGHKLVDGYIRQAQNEIE